MPKGQRESGFTVVEIVVVIALIAIVAAVTIGRYLGVNTFNALAIQGQVLSIIRIGQQSAFGRENVAVTIIPNSTATELTVIVADSGGQIESTTVNMSGSSLTGDVNITDSCAVTPGTTTITNANPLVLNFGTLGDLQNSGFGTGNPVNSAVRVCVNNEASSSVCVSPAGFAYEGDCDD